MTVTSRAEWRAWLTVNHRQTDSIWLVHSKKAAGSMYIGYDAIVEEALCFGWIDSLPRKLDADRTMLLLSPRKPGSAWSRLNKERVVRLTKAGLMAPPGLERVRQAKSDGSWKALDAVEQMTVPTDLAAALRANPPAGEHFAAFPRSARRGILEWIAAAKRPATRMARIEQTATLAARNIRANHPQGNKPIEMTNVRRVTNQSIM